jgi:acyl-CoA thioesterase-1
LNEESRRRALAQVPAPIFNGIFMKKIISYLAAIGFNLIIGLILIGCDTGNNSEINNIENKTVVCLGNSLTAGYGATTPGIDDKTRSYPSYLQDKINIPVVNAGVSGDTTAQGLARINTDVLSEDPLIVIIELGANDLFHVLPPGVTKNNLQSIISMVNDGNRKIYVAKFYTEEVARALANSIGITNYNLQTMLINQYDEMFETLAASNNVELIEDIWSGVWSVHMSDEVHPNARGYEIMANNYYNALKPYLQARGLLK